MLVPVSKPVPVLLACNSGLEAAQRGRRLSVTSGTGGGSGGGSEGSAGSADSGGSERSADSGCQGCSVDSGCSIGSHGPEGLTDSSSPGP
ncbi:hypothetical protein ETD85_60865 [Nonomuraea zeae]|uniref:Uncharacterized protein n=1 Tax=Nonomuraea zeae TaxID=1642303 RepID=A0A5S4F2D8_9ACTN|nr:hypothetical protein ETD85_60865 [Nonomuraea zeae]